MAQTSISGFYPVRRRRDGDHASTKRRKLTESVRLDIPVVEECSDTTSIPLTKTTKVVTTAKKRVTRAKKGAKQKAATRSNKTTKNAKSLQTLFDQISQPNNTEQDKTSTKDSSNVPVTKRDLPTPETSPPPAVDTIPVLLSPCTDTMTKLASVKSSTPGPSRPALSRGAALVQLAKQKMSPCKSESTVRETRASTRRKLLATDRKEMSRTEVVGEMHKLSARELALPTKHERRVKKSDRPSLREFGTIEIESPKKKGVPAHQRYHSLAQPSFPPTTDGPDLSLPLSYKLLSEKFRCTDTVVNMIQKRKEICTFTKLKRAVQEMSRREFEQRNLSQMKTVCPEAFVFRQENNIPGSFDYRGKHLLTIECDTSEVDQGFLNPTDLIKRRKIFHRGLVSIVRDHHKTFLSKLRPPLVIPDDKVLRWHPEFRLDILPEVSESTLPQPPIKESYSGAADVLKAAQSCLAPRVQTALSNASGDQTNGEEEPATPPIQTDPSLKGVSQALLDKIRAKEAAKAHSSITRDPVKERKLEMISRLPEFVRILRTFFVSEKKAALLWDDVVAKLTESYLSKLAKDRVERHLTFMTEVLPHWVKMVTIGKKRYVKLDRKADVKAVLKTIEEQKLKL